MHGGNSETGTAMILRWQCVSLILSAFVFLTATNLCKAANFSIVAENPSKPFYSGIARLVIDGEIKTGDFAQFAKMADIVSHEATLETNGVPAIEVDLNSPGGDLNEAIQIGRLLRDRSMQTGLSAKSICASACIFIYIAGVSRSTHTEARLGLHRPYFNPVEFASLSPAEARKKYASLVTVARDYFLDMGMSEESFRLMMATPSNDIHWLNMLEQIQYGFFGVDPAWTELSIARLKRDWGDEKAEAYSNCVNKGEGFKSCSEKFLKQ
jgi:ATP-dependent protease ClpP protease subunit